MISCYMYDRQAITCEAINVWLNECGALFAYTVKGSSIYKKGVKDPVAVILSHGNMYRMLVVFSDEDKLPQVPVCGREDKQCSISLKGINMSSLRRVLDGIGDLHKFTEHSYYCLDGAVNISAKNGMVTFVAFGPNYMEMLGILMGFVEEIGRV